MFRNTRRDFLKTAAIGLPSILVSPTIFAHGSAEGANDRLRVGYVGVGNMGRGDAVDFSSLADVVAVCDVVGGMLSAALGSDGIGTR
ncbi:MAG: hypothetical protein Q4C47_06070, partial [Planctomycetia bacterium]|nr:hypothetical protein [Planctomycetia bacterium]